MEDIVREEAPCFAALGRLQDRIGWNRFLEGMVSKEIALIQRNHTAVTGSHLSIKRWMSGLITRLLKIPHGQWLYCNVVVHDLESGVIATKKKEEIQQEIELQQELGDEGLLEEDKWLAEVNLECMASTLGVRQEYWLLVIRTSRKDYQLREQ